MASAFEQPFLFLRHPNGGVEDLDRMKAAGFHGVFCNIGDHPPEAWEAVVRPRAASRGMFCGPWAHTRDERGYAPHVLEELVRVADRWGSPLIVNSEKEIDGSGEEITGQIAEEVGDRDAAISMEAWLFNPPSVDWTPVAHLPMLLQIFPQESPPSSDPWGCKEHAHACGIRCVYFTFGSYGAVGADSYDLASPYSVYTGDDCGGDYAAWSPTSSGFPACAEEPAPLAPPWWESAYRGAPPPGGLIPLARPLYPPDANKRGKKPSSDGPDVLAIKRGISRLGRWPWGKFDDSFSNAFSHGKPPGNVGESGLAGFQRQMDIDPTGWYGEGSHKALQYALIPEGLPHGGEHGLDDVARDLLRDAVAQFKGDMGTVRASALAEARTWLGYTESPPGTNASVFGSWYGMNYEPWCAMFVTYCYELGGPSPSFAAGSRYAYCPYILNDARDRRNGLALTLEPIPGDLVLYDWAGDGLPDHVGLFERWTGVETFEAVEGNTSTSNNSNGGEVMRRKRSMEDGDVYFVTVAEP